MAPLILVPELIHRVVFSKEHPQGLLALRRCTEGTTPRDTCTITAAARLVGVPKGKLYQTIHTDQHQVAPRKEPGQALTVTVVALQTASFAVPTSALPSPPAAPDTETTARASGGTEHVYNLMCALAPAVPAP